MRRALFALLLVCAHAARADELTPADMTLAGSGPWGRNLVSSVHGTSERIRFVAGATRPPDKARQWCEQHGIRLADRYETLLADKSVDAVVLATPHSLHCAQIIAAARAGQHV